MYKRAFILSISNFLIFFSRAKVKGSVMGKKALITGITGQDGSYLAELLLSKGYEVHGLKRRSSSFNTVRIDHIYSDPHFESNKFFAHFGDMTDSTNLIRVVKEVEPDEIYNLAAQSHVQVSFETAEYTANADGIGTLRLLEAIRLLGFAGTTKFYQASTSEMFGLVNGTSPLNEQSPFYPRSPYGVAKLYAHWMTINYREAYNIFASNGILFNHESPRRGETFVTRKIVRAATQIVQGRDSTLFLGNLDAIRDWGHAKDYVEGMWRILQHTEADDFVLATGFALTVRDFCSMVFAELGVRISWSGLGIDEVGKDQTGRVLVRIDARYFRPTEVPFLLGDATKARNVLGWEPKYGIEDLISEMVKSELEVMGNKHN
jgi:GDPmannose 4,6-dehydratase